MPFTFSRALDPAVQAPEVQREVVGCLATIDWVDAARDASAGAIARALSPWGCMSWRHPLRGMVFIRRYAAPEGPDGWLRIGVELDDEAWCITAATMRDAEAARLAALPALPPPQPGLPRWCARAIARGGWDDPAQGLSPREQRAGATLA